MITIDSLIGQMKNLFAIKTPVRFDTPEYIQFHSDLIQYIYENHFEESDEWKIISRNLVYTSTQRMAVGDGNTILIQLDALKRRELGLRFAVDWKLVHPDIIRVARSLYQDGHYFESARSAFIEINAKVKKLFPELRGKDGKRLDGYPLMQTVFSAKSPEIVIADTSTDTGENVQRGFMDMFAGAAAALRNPKAHENDSITAENTRYAGQTGRRSPAFAPVSCCVTSPERKRVKIAPPELLSGFGPIFGAPKSGQEKGIGAFPHLCHSRQPAVRAATGVCGILRLTLI